MIIHDIEKMKEELEFFKRQAEMYRATNNNLKIMLIVATIAIAFLIVVAFYV